MKYYNFFALIKRKSKKKNRIIKDKVKMERDRETEIEMKTEIQMVEMKTEIQMVFVTNARQTKKSKIVATTKPKIV